MFLKAIRRILSLLRPKYDDDKYDRWNYAYTTSFLFMALVLVCLKQTIGHPVRCWIPAEFDKNWKFDRRWQAYTERYCFVENNYFIEAKDGAMPPLVTGADYEIRYYQWVCAYLAVQIILFMIPRNFWSFASEKSGLDLYSIYGKVPPGFGKVGELADNFKTYGQRVHNILDSESKSRERFWRVIPHTSYLTFVYLFYKFLQCFNVVLQVFLMNHYLNTTYSFWGFGVFRDLISNGNWKTSGRFPRVTQCNFIRRDETSSAPIEYPIQCVLMINMFNELLCIVLWVWLTFLTFVNVTSLIYWIITSFSGKYHKKIVKDFIGYAKTIGLKEIKFTDGDVNHFIRTRLFKDGITTVRLISKTIGNYHASGIVHAMFEEYKNVQKVEDKKDECDHIPKPIVSVPEDELAEISDSIKNENALSLFLGTYLNYDHEQFESTMNQFGQAVIYHLKKIKTRISKKPPVPVKSILTPAVLPVAQAKPSGYCRGSIKLDNIREEDIDTTTMKDEDNKAGRIPFLPFPYFPDYFAMPDISVPPPPSYFPPPYFGDNGNNIDELIRQRAFGRGYRPIFRTPYTPLWPNPSLPSSSGSGAQNPESALPSYSDFSRDRLTPPYYNTAAFKSFLDQKDEQKLPNAEKDSLQNVKKTDEIKEAANRLTEAESNGKPKLGETSEIYFAPVPTFLSPVSTQTLDDIIIPKPEELWEEILAENLHARELERSKFVAEASVDKEAVVKSNFGTLENVVKADDTTVPEFKQPIDEKAKRLPHECLKPLYGKEDNGGKAAHMVEFIHPASRNNDVNATSDDNESYYSAEENVKGEKSVDAPESIGLEQTVDSADPVTTAEPKSDEPPASGEANHSRNSENLVNDKPRQPLILKSTKSFDDVKKNIVELVSRLNPSKDDSVPQKEEYANVDLKDVESDKALPGKDESEKGTEKRCDLVKLSSYLSKLSSLKEPTHSEGFKKPEFDKCISVDLSNQQRAGESLARDDAMKADIEVKDGSIPQNEEHANVDVEDAESNDEGFIENGESEKNAGDERESVEPKSDESSASEDTKHSLNFENSVYEKSDEIADEISCQSADQPLTLETTASHDDVAGVEDLINDDRIPPKEENAIGDVKDVESDEALLESDSENLDSVELPALEEENRLLDYDSPDYAHQPIKPESTISFDDVMKNSIEAVEVNPDLDISLSNQFEDDSVPEKEEYANADLKDVESDEALPEKDEFEKDDMEKEESVNQIEMPDDGVFFPPQVNEDAIPINVGENIEPEYVEIPMAKKKDDDSADQSKKALIDARFESVHNNCAIPEPRKEIENTGGDPLEATDMPNEAQVDECLGSEIPSEKALPTDDKDLSQEPVLQKVADNLYDDLQKINDAEKPSEAGLPISSSNCIEETPEVTNTEIDGHLDINQVDGKGDLFHRDVDSLIPPSEAIAEDSSDISLGNPPYPETADMILEGAEEVVEPSFNDALLISPQNEEQLDSHKNGEEDLKPQNVEVFIPSLKAVAEDGDISLETPPFQIVEEANTLLTVDNGGTQNVKDVHKFAADEFAIPLVEAVEANQIHGNFLPFDPVVEQIVENLVNNFTIDWPKHSVIDESEVKETNVDDSGKEKDE